MTDLPLLQGYAPAIQDRARELLAAGDFEPQLRVRYPEGHAVRSNKELFAYVQELKARHMQNAPQLAKVAFDPRLTSVRNALGIHMTTLVAHGKRLRKRRELRVASLFKDLPAAFLRMIVVHELAHMKRAEHDREFYRLCCHMEPDYHELELDLRVLLSATDFGTGATPPENQPVTDPSTFQTLAASIGCRIELEAAEQLLAYLDAMLDENQRVNLTAVREREAAVLFHALDSVAMGASSIPQAPRKALDLGTGNGFPGVAILCLFPGAHVLLMDRTLKKLKAIERALLAAGFDPRRFSIAQMDAAEAPAHGHRAAFDLITTRAVGPPAEVGLLAQPLLARGGRLLTWLSDDTEAPTTLKGGLRRLGQFDYQLPPPADRWRWLAQYGH